MKKSLFILLFVVCLIPCFSFPAQAGLGDLDSTLKTNAITGSGECSGGASGSNCAAAVSCPTAVAPACSQNGGSFLAAMGSGGGFFSGIIDFFKQLFRGIGDFFRNLFSGNNDGNNGTSAPPISSPPIAEPPVTNTPVDNVDTTVTPPVDNTATTTPPVDDVPTTPPVDETNTTETNTPETNTPVGNLPIKVDVRTGGKSLENGAYNWARGAVQPRTNDGTVLRHEAVHYINGQLTQNLGSNGGWNNLSPNINRGFYLWGENKFWVIPNTTLKKGEVESLVPTHLTTSHRNYFHNFDFGSRDALHIMEDFSAEISSGEKSHLLFDMMIFSAAMGLKLEQQAAQGTNNYWLSEGGAILRGTIKTFFEKAGMSNSSYMQTFRSDTNPKTIAIIDFLRRIYGSEWTKKVIGV